MGHLLSQAEPSEARSLSLPHVVHEVTPLLKLHVLQSLMTFPHSENTIICLTLTNDFVERAEITRIGTLTLYLFSCVGKQALTMISTESLALSMYNYCFL